MTITGTKISRGSRKSVRMVNFPITANPAADIIPSASTMARMAIEDKYPLRQDKFCLRWWGHARNQEKRLRNAASSTTAVVRVSSTVIEPGCASNHWNWSSQGSICLSTLWVMSCSQREHTSFLTLPEALVSSRARLPPISPSWPSGVAIAWPCPSLSPMFVGDTNLRNTLGPVRSRRNMKKTTIGTRPFCCSRIQTLVRKVGQITTGW